MSVVISNVSEHGDLVGTNSYEVGLSGKPPIARFEHRRDEGLAACLRAAADAVERADGEDAPEAGSGLPEEIAAILARNGSYADDSGVSVRMGSLRSLARTRTSSEPAMAAAMTDVLRKFLADRQEVWRGFLELDPQDDLASKEWDAIEAMLRLLPTPRPDMRSTSPAAGSPGDDGRG